MESWLFDYLSCPISRQTLRLLTSEELTQINGEIAGNNTRCHNGDSPATLSAGLVTQDGTFVYRIENSQPYLLPDMAILRS